MSVEMTLNGEYQNLLSLLDTVEGIDYLRISKLSYVWSVNLESTELDRMSIGFEVTMIKNVDFSKVEAETEQGEDEDELWHGLDLS